MSFNFDFKKIRFKNGKTIEQQLKYEADRFKNILQRHIDDWYAAYSPTVYSRTYNMRNSIYADDLVDIDTSSGSLKISVKYTDAAFHDSMYGDEQVNTLYLENYRYQVQKPVWFKDIEYFGYRSAGHFLENAVEEFNQDNYFGIKVEVINPDSIYK